MLVISFPWLSALSLVHEREVVILANTCDVNLYLVREITEMRKKCHLYALSFK